MSIRHVSAALALDARANLAESPVWDDRRQVLWWVDILAGRIHRFDPTNESDRSIELGGPIGFVTLTERGSLVAGAIDGLVRLDPDTGERCRIVAFAGIEAAGDPREAGPSAREVPAAALRCNDGKSDPTGRLWFGRLALDKAVGAARLERFADGLLVRVISHLTIPNGLDWSADGRTMYFVDSTDHFVAAMDFDPETGSPGPRRVLWRTSDVPDLPAGSVPDGLTVDDEDFLWVAIWGGGCVLRIAPNGRVERRIDVPVPRVSSCAFGGAELDELFITTAREDASQAELAAAPTAGGIFRAGPGVRGRPPNRMRFDAALDREALA